MNTALPIPPTKAKGEAMRRQRIRDTEPELALRRELHRRGLRYRIHRRAIPELNRRIDIVFSRARVAVDVRGCFWHACPAHATSPKANSDWWARKLDRNVERDRETERQLAKAGWKVLVVWEHEDPDEAAQRIAEILELRATGA